jgi:PST family polysaccharide transporter
LTQAPLLAFAWVALAEVIVATIALLSIYGITGGSISKWVVSFALGRKLLHQGFPILLSSLFVLANMTLDKMMVGELSGDAQLGLYSAALTLSNVWYFIPVIFGTSLLPALVKAREIGEKDYLAKLQYTYNFMTICGVVVAVPTTFLSPFLVRLLYGPQYAAAADILSIHVWTCIFVFHVSMRTRALVIEGRQALVASMAFLTLAANVALNLALIPPYGARGAAIAALLSWILGVLIVPMFSSRTMDSAVMFCRSIAMRKPNRDF